MNKSAKHTNSSVIDFSPSTMKDGRKIEFDRENQTIGIHSRFENVLVQQKELKIDLPYNKKKIQIIKSVGEFIAKTPNITQSIIKFVLQLNKSTSITLLLKDWDDLDIVFMGASVSHYNGELDNLNSDFFNYQTICQDLSDFINSELDKVHESLS